MSITEGEFERSCDLHVEGTFHGAWGKVEMKIVDIQNGRPDRMDEISEMKMLYSEEKRAIDLGEHELVMVKSETCKTKAVNPELKLSCAWKWKNRLGSW